MWGIPAVREIPSARPDLANDCRYRDCKIGLPFAATRIIMLRHPANDRHDPLRCPAKDQE
jgi:hypothetical protein